MNENWPEAYKKGVQNFYGRDFLVSPAVLIPRPETEMMIDEVLALAGKAYLPGIKTPERKLSENPVILDVGTGSGCVATTIKLEIPEAKVIGLDVSTETLKVARQNAEKLGADVEFIRSDLLSNYKGENPDVVVANLPYVDESWEWLDKKALSVEPELALYAKNHGLELIFKLIEQAKDKCKWMILEADPCQHEQIIDFAKSFGFSHEKTSGFQLVFYKN